MVAKILFGVLDPASDPLCSGQEGDVPREECQIPGTETIWSAQTSQVEDRAKKPDDQE